MENSTTGRMEVPERILFEFKGGWPTRTQHNSFYIGRRAGSSQGLQNFFIGPDTALAAWLNVAACHKGPYASPGRTRTWKPL